jgi:crotonobetainyl-CoA:carnitine CoA-transferase CaiB-like acyl-CoA transferase
MAGAIATMILADAGADVIRVEPPAGDRWAAMPAYRQWQRGKRVLRLDLKRDAGQAEARRLAREADVVLETYRPGVADRLGFGYAALRETNRDLIYCSISGFGDWGPYRNYPGYDALVAAKSGRMMSNQWQVPREGPIYQAVPLASYGAAQNALHGILAALYARPALGRGQWVKTSLLRGMMVYDLNQWLSFQTSGGKLPNFRTLGTIFKERYLVAQSKDGYWLQFANNAPHLFRAFLRETGLERLAQDPRFPGLPEVPAEHVDELHEALLECIATKTRDEWMAIALAERNIALEPLVHTREGMDHPQVIHNRNVITLQDPELGPVRQIGVPARFSETPLAPQGPAPVPVDHADWKETKRPERGPSGDAAELPDGPLSGLFIVDFSTWIAGSYGTVQLADLGARVIKVEPLEGDLMRLSASGQGAAKTTLGKEGLAVDLKKEEGRAIVHKLMAQADVVAHNFRPGAPERLGIDYATARRLRPDVIYIYAASYGSDGPYAHRPAFHPIAGAIAGNGLWQAGAAMPPPPEQPLTAEERREVSRQLGRANEGNPDPNSALMVATAILLALQERQRSGRGQYLETTMVGSNALVCSDDFIDYPGAPRRRLPDGDLRGLWAWYRLYEAAAGWVFLACTNTREWGRFCEATGHPEWRAAYPADGELDAAADAALVERLAAEFATRTAADWETALIAAGVPCVRADAGTQAQFMLQDPGSLENDLSIPVQSYQWGRVMRPGLVAELSETPGIARPSCALGEHTYAILTELGYGEEAIERLRAERVVRMADPIPSP